MRLTLLFLLFISQGSASAQKSTDKALELLQIDSIRLNVELNRDKEMLLQGQEEVHRLLGTAHLDSKTASKFMNRLEKNSSYEMGRALLSHHNLDFTCYSAGKAVLTVQISTLTRNINIYTKDGQESYRKISKKMGNYLVKLLIKLDLYDPLKEIGDTEGID